MANAGAWLKAKQLDMAKGIKAQMTWLSSSEAKQRGAAAKAHAISEFKKRFPNADISKFKVQVEFDQNRKATGEVLFPESDGSLTDLLMKDRKYWSQPLQVALQLHQDGGFPLQLSPTNNPQKPIPAVDFSEEIQSSIGDVLNKELKIYVTPTEYFTTKFREIFKNTQITFTTAKYARKRLGGPNMGFWPQQLNFALWCATTGCGVSRAILFPTGYLDLSPQIRSFFLFHVYFTVRRILYEMGGIKSVFALLTNLYLSRKRTSTTLNPTKKICGEFGIDPSADFRFTHGKNHGLGNVYIWVAYSGPRSTDYNYPDPNQAFFDDEHLTDIKDPNYRANGIYFMRNDQGADKQFEYFVPNYSQGFTRAGLARINQSIEAFCFCFLGSQAETRVSILGGSGGATETQRVPRSHRRLYQTYENFR